MGRANIEFEGTVVGVGSGWSDAQRIKYHDHPEELIGKVINVQYFETTIDSKTGKPSLRFPTVKHVHEEEKE
jgi:DNA ligase-1